MQSLKQTLNITNGSQLINGCNETDLRAMRLVRDPSSYNYVKNSTDNNQTSSNDKSDYKAVVGAMNTLGFTHMETQTIWNVVAGVLHLVSQM